MNVMFYFICFFSLIIHLDISLSHFVDYYDYSIIKSILRYIHSSIQCPVNQIKPLCPRLNIYVMRCYKYWEFVVMLRNRQTLVKKTLRPVKQADGWDARVTLMTLFGNILIYLTRMYETKYKSQHRKTLKQIDNSCKFFSKDMLLNRSVSEMSLAWEDKTRWTAQVTNKVSKK